MSNATAGAVELAAEKGIDLEGLTGSGKDGKVTKADIEALAAAEEEVAALKEVDDVPKAADPNRVTWEEHLRGIPGYKPI